MITTLDVIIALIVGTAFGMLVMAYVYETFVVSHIETSQFKRQNETLTAWYQSTPHD